MLALVSDRVAIISTNGPCDGELMSLSGMVEIPCLQAKSGFVMPAKAGASIFGFVGRPKKTWIPAYAGMTKGRVDF